MDAIVYGGCDDCRNGKECSVPSTILYEIVPSIFKQNLEQYYTPDEIAKQFFDCVSADQPNLIDLIVADFGAGYLALTRHFLNRCRYIYSVEIDTDIVTEIVDSLSELPHRMELVNSSYEDFQRQVDIVISNPPFGQYVFNAQKVLLTAISNNANTAYLLLRSADVYRLLPIATSYRYVVVRLKDIKFPIPKQFSYHSKPVYYIDCCIVKLQRHKIVWREVDEVTIITDDEPSFPYLDRVNPLHPDELEPYAIAHREFLKLPENKPTPEDFFNMRVEEPIGTYSVFYILEIPSREIPDWYIFLRKLRKNALYFARLEYLRGRIVAPNQTDYEEALDKVCSESQPVLRTHWLRVNVGGVTKTGIFTTRHFMVYNKTDVNVKIGGWRDFEIYQDITGISTGLFMPVHVRVGNDLHRYGMSPKSLSDVEHMIHRKEYKDVLALLGVDIDVCKVPTLYCCKTCRVVLRTIGFHMLYIWLECQRFVRKVLPYYDFRLLPDNIDFTSGILDFGDYKRRTKSVVTDVDILTALLPIRECLQNIYGNCGLMTTVQFSNSANFVGYLTEVVAENYDKPIIKSKILSDNAFVPLEVTVEQFDNGLLLPFKDVDCQDRRYELQSYSQKIIDLILSRREVLSKQDFVCVVGFTSIDVTTVVNLLLSIVMHNPKIRVSWDTYKLLWLTDEYAGFRVPRGTWNLFANHEGDSAWHYRTLKHVLTILANYRYDNGIDMFECGIDMQRAQIINGVPQPVKIVYPMIGELPLCDLSLCKHPMCKLLSTEEKTIFMYALATTMYNSIKLLSVDLYDEYNNVKFLGRISDFCKIQTIPSFRVNIDYRFIDWFVQQTGTSIRYLSDPSTPSDFEWEINSMYWRGDRDCCVSEIKLFGTPLGGSMSDGIALTTFCIAHAAIEEEISKAVERGAMRPMFLWNEQQNKSQHGKSSGTPINTLGVDARGADHLLGDALDASLVHAGEYHTPSVTQMNVKVAPGVKSRVRSLAGASPITTIKGRAYAQSLRITLMKGDLYKIGIGTYRRLFHNSLCWHFAFQHKVREERRSHKQDCACDLCAHHHYVTGAHDCPSYDRTVDIKNMALTHLLCLDYPTLGPGASREYYDDGNVNGTYEEKCYQAFKNKYPTKTPAEIAFICFSNLSFSAFADLTFNYIRFGEVMGVKCSGVSSGGPHTADFNGHNHLLMILAAMLSASRSESNMPPYLAIAAAFKSPQNVILHSYALGAEVRGSTTLTYCTVTMSVPVQTLFVNQHYGQRYASASNPPPEAALLRIQGQQSIRMPAAHGRLIVDYAAYQKKAIAASGDYPPLVDVIANPTLIETMPGSTASRLTTAPETLDFKFSSASFPPMESKAVTELRSIFKSRYGSKTIVAVANDGITTKTGKPSEFSASSYIDYIAFFVQDDMTDNAILRYNTMSWYIANGSGGSFTFQNIVSGARVDDAALIQSLTNRWKTLSTVASSSG